MRRILTVGLVAAALAIVFACDPFPDVDALGGGDAGSSTGVDGGGGSGVDGGGSAAADAGGDVDGGGRFCSQATHAFCADLDGPEALATQWTEVDPGVAIVSTPTASGTGALHFTLARTTNAAAGEVLKKSLDVPVANVSLAFDAYWVKPSWSAGDNGNVFLASLDIGQAHFYLWIDRSGLLGITSNSPDPYSVRAQTGGLADRAWTHVALVVTPLSSKAEVVSLGTPPVVAVSQTVPMEVGTDAKGITLTVGLFVSNTPTPPFEIYFDNIALDVSN
jgi:hypothetical protein